MAVLGRTIVLPTRNYQTGTEQVTLPDPPAGATVVAFEIARCTSAEPNIWPNEATVFAARLEESLDGGATWDRAIGFSASGGIVLDKSGAEATVSSLSAALRAGSNRKLRATVTITNGPLRSTGTLEYRDG